MSCFPLIVAWMVAGPAQPAVAEPHGGYLIDTFKCSACHTPHAALGQTLFILPSEKQVCYSCHDGTGSTYDTQSEFGESVLGTSTALSHHPVPEGTLTCGNCHTPHTGPSTGNPMSLAVGPSRIATGSAVCGGCHGPGSKLPGGDHLSTIVGSPHEESVTPPASGTQIRCEACHETHGSSNASLMRTEVRDSWGVTETVVATSSATALCLTCHAQSNGVFPGGAVYSATRHSTVGTSSVAATSWPGLAKHNGDCDNCHEPHGKGTGIQYTRASGNQLCFTCHDAAGTTKPATYSYQGSTAYAGSPHSAATGVSWQTLHTDEKGFAAWESTAPQTPSSPGAAINATAGLLAQDGTYVRTTLADTTGQTDYQMYRFRLAKGATGLEQLKVTWIGYGSAVPGYPVQASVWDQVAGAWVSFASVDAATETTLTTTTPSPSRFVDGNGYVWVLAQARKAVDADMNGGVTLSAPSTISVSAGWGTLGPASSWVDYGVFAPPPYQSTAGDPALTVSHTVGFPIVAPGVYHYSVRGTDANGVTVASPDAMFGWPPPTLTPVGSYGTFGSGANVPLSWSENEGTRAPYTFRVKITSAGGYSYTSAWQSATTLTSPYLALGTYTWQVQAQDASGILTPWSVPDTFSVVWVDPYAQAPAPTDAPLFARALRAVAGWMAAAFGGVTRSDPVAAPMVLAEAPVLHRSLNSDAVMLEAGYDSLNAGACQQCHAAHGAAGPDGTPYVSMESVPEVSNCLGNGTGGCHASAASADGVNISASINASAGASTHHDLLPSQQAASGARIKCSDCHNPHKETPSDPFSDPSSIGSAVTPATTKYFDASGSLYVLVGAEHDGVAPVITNLQMDVTTPTAPAFTWTTNEPATTWLDWGTTTSYELGSFGTSLPLTTAHRAVAPTSTPGVTYHYRIRSADALGNERVTNDATVTIALPPSAPASITPSAYSWNGSGPATIPVPVSWTAATPGDSDPLQYQVYLDGVGQGWISSTSTTLSVPTNSNTSPGVGVALNHPWYVVARDSVHTYESSGHSPTGTVTVTDNFDYWAYSCPILYSWNGKGFGYVTDVMGRGAIGIQVAPGEYRYPPSIEDSRIDAAQLKPVNGKYELRLKNEKDEIEYVDNVYLEAVDHPKGTQVYLDDLTRTFDTRGLGDATIYTVRDPKPVKATYDNVVLYRGKTVNGLDITSDVAHPDGKFAPASLFDDNRYTFDLGRLAGAKTIKLVMRGWSEYATPLERSAWLASGSKPASMALDVADARGRWVTIDEDLSFIPGFDKTVVFDLSGKFPKGVRDYKVRMRGLTRTHIDWVAVDTSPQGSVHVTRMDPVSARFAYRGQSARGTGAYPTYEYGTLLPNPPQHTGAFTKFGDVRELLASADDRYVIMDTGDEISLSFPEVPVAAGMERTYVIHTDGYFQELTGKVDPLPFHAMSNFPYPKSEHYPNDPVHQRYLNDWNTRVHTASARPAAKPGVWERVRTWFAHLAGSIHRLIASRRPSPKANVAVGRKTVGPRRDIEISGTTTRRVAVPGRHYSINTDQLVLRSLGLARGYITYAPDAAWESAGTSAGPTPSSPGSPADASTVSGLAALDGTYWRTGLASADKDWNWQVVRFDLTQAARDRIGELRVLWTGYGEPTAGYATRLAIWNAATGSWDATEQVTAMGSAGMLGAAKSAVPPSVCLSCHSGTTPAGVVMPSGITTIGPTWSGGVDPSWHSGSAVSAGFGGGLIAEYQFGRAPDIACTTCHDPHGSANPYHIPSTVKDQTSIVVTSSASAETFCRACHTGTVYQMHQQCATCHLQADNPSDPFSHGTYDWQTPQSGTNCLDCHGHGKRWQHAAYDPTSCDCHGDGNLSSYVWRTF